MRSKILRIPPGLCLGAVLGLIGMGGCGSNPPPPPDPDQARTALRTVLDAWKHGDAPDALSQARPPIHVSDWRWRSGVRLTRYEIDEQDRRLGPYLRCSVRLWTDPGKGKTIPEKAEYDVATSPALTVRRASDH
jgi:hypothetical protein